jgi:hypothetical protein
MEKIQEILFENKQSIPDGVYLQLMNNLKIEDKKFYKIKYHLITPTVNYYKNDNNFSVNHNRFFHNKTYETILDTTELNLNYERGIIEQLEKGEPFITFCKSIPQPSINDIIRHRKTIKKEK